MCVILCDVSSPLKIWDGDRSNKLLIHGHGYQGSQFKSYIIYVSINTTLVFQV